MTDMTIEHLDDGALIRLVDDALELDERAAVLDHVQHCVACRARVAEFRTLTRGWTRVLDITDGVPASRAEPVRRRGSRRTWLRAAAVILALATLTAPPVRALLADVWARATGNAAPPAVESPAPVDDGTTLTFAFDAPTFLLRFDAAQAAGDLEITFDSATVAAFRIDGPVRDGAIVRPDGLDVRNAADETTAYRLVVPASVRTVRVMIGGVEVRTVDRAAAADAGVRVPVR